MLWRLVGTGLAPTSLQALALMAVVQRNAQERLCVEPVVEVAGKARAHFVVDSTGSASRVGDQVQLKAISSLDEVALKGLLSSPALMSAYASVAASAITVADATYQGATRATTALRDAAEWTSDTTRESLSRLFRQATNADVREELHVQAEQRIDFHGAKAWSDLLRALFAVGIALAGADGEISAQERENIKEFIGGAAYSSLPTVLVGAVEGWFSAPPSIEEAFMLASQCGPEAMSTIDQVMQVVIQSDGEVHPAELEFCDRWRVMCEGAYT